MLRDGRRIPPQFRVLSESARAGRVDGGPSARRSGDDDRYFVELPLSVTTRTRRGLALTSPALNVSVYMS